MDPSGSDFSYPTSDTAAPPTYQFAQPAPPPQQSFNQYPPATQSGYVQSSPQAPGNSQSVYAQPTVSVPGTQQYVQDSSVPTQGNFQNAYVPPGTPMPGQQQQPYQPQTFAPMSATPQQNTYVPQPSSMTGAIQQGYYNTPALQQQIASTIDLSHTYNSLPTSPVVEFLRYYNLVMCTEQERLNILRHIQPLNSHKFMEMLLWLVSTDILMSPEKLAAYMQVGYRGVVDIQLTALNANLRLSGQPPPFAPPQTVGEVSLATTPNTFLGNEPRSHVTPTGAPKAPSATEGVDTLRSTGIPTPPPLSAAESLHRLKVLTNLSAYDKPLEKGDVGKAKKQPSTKQSRAKPYSVSLSEGANLHPGTTLHYFKKDKEFNDRKVPFAQVLINPISVLSNGEKYVDFDVAYRAKVQGFLNQKDITLDDAMLAIQAFWAHHCMSSGVHLRGLELDGFRYWLRSQEVLLSTRIAAKVGPGLMMYQTFPQIYRGNNVRAKEVMNMELRSLCQSMQLFSARRSEVILYHRSASESQTMADVYTAADLAESFELRVRAKEIELESQEKKIMDLERRDAALVKRLRRATRECWEYGRMARQLDMLHDRFNHLPKVDKEQSPSTEESREDLEPITPVGSDADDSEEEQPGTSAQAIAKSSENTRSYALGVTKINMG